MHERTGDDLTDQEMLSTIQQGREVGQLQAMMQDEPEYILIAHQVYPNGTTGPVVTDPDTAKRIGELTGLGEPTDPVGYGIWQVPK